MRWGDHDTTQTRQAFFDDVAPSLVDAVIGPLPPFVGSRKLSGQFAFHGNDETLAIVSWPKATQVSADEALAWGLAWSGDRDVVLVLPRDRVTPTLQRLPWVSAPVKVFTFDPAAPNSVAPAIVPSRGEVLAAVAGWGRRGSAEHHGLNADEAAWVAPLIEWADAEGALSPRHRTSYLAWHTAGRQVLKIQRASGGLAIDAGVRYTKPTADQPTPPPTLHVTTALTADELTAIQSTVEQAIDRRSDGHDSGHEEHRLQHALDDRFEADGSLLGLTQLRREYPAWRPGRSAAYIDFLGASADATPHIVETKLDNDPMLALQGLDYWIWATANPGLMRELFGTDKTAGPVIDFVVGAHKTTKAVGPYTLRQLEALDGAISWRFHVARDWTAQLHIESLPPRRTPEPPVAWDPVTPPRYAQRLQHHLLAMNHDALKGSGPFLAEPDAGVLDQARPAWHDLQERGLLHRYAHHVRSSQIFALNLFAGLDEPTRMAIAGLVGVVDVVEAHDVIFEFEDDGDLLAEATAASPHRTQTDVAMQCRAKDGTRTLILVEVKLSELDFGHCSAYQSAKNDTRAVCRRDGPFGNDPARCFQLRNHDAGERRTYDVHLGPTPTTGNGCSFRLGTNQPMRNVALGRALIARGDTEFVVHTLAAPTANEAIWRRWREAKRALDGIGGVRLADMPAEQLIDLLEPERAEHLKERYRLR